MKIRLILNCEEITPLRASWLSKLDQYLLQTEENLQRLPLSKIYECESFPNSANFFGMEEIQIFFQGNLIDVDEVDFCKIDEKFCAPNSFNKTFVVPSISKEVYEKKPFYVNSTGKLKKKAETFFY